MAAYAENSVSIPEWKTGVKDILQLMDFIEVIKDLKIIKRDKRATAESKDQAISIILAAIKEWSDVLGLKNVTKNIMARYLGESEKDTSIALVNKCLKRWNVPASFQVEMTHVFQNFAKSFVAALNFLRTGTEPTKELPLKYCITESCQLSQNLPESEHMPDVSGKANVIRALSILNLNLVPKYDDTLIINLQNDICSIDLAGTCTKGTEDAEFQLNLKFKPGTMASKIRLQIERPQSMSTLSISEP